MLPCAGRPVSRQAVRVQPSQAGFSRCDVHLVEGSSERRVLRGIVGSKASNPEAKLLTFFHFLVVSLDSIPQLLHAIGQARLAVLAKDFSCHATPIPRLHLCSPKWARGKRLRASLFIDNLPTPWTPRGPPLTYCFPLRAFDSLCAGGEEPSGPGCKGFHSLHGASRDPSALLGAEL